MTLFGDIKTKFRFFALQTLMFAAFFACSIQSANAQNPDAGDIETGLVGWWKLDETSGSTYTDSSPTGNTGTSDNNMSGNFTEGKIGSAVEFYSNTNAVVAASAPYNNLNQITIAFWAKPRQLAGGYMNVLRGAGIEISNQWNTNNIYLYVNRWDGNNGRWSFNWGSAYEVGKWHHYVITYDFTAPAGTDPTYYKDGVAQSVAETGTPTGTIQPSTYTDFRIGQFSSSGHNFKGALDDFRIYNRQLSADDVALLYRSYPGPYADAAGACDAAHEAVMIFNHNEKIMQYCNGSEWVNVGLNKKCATESCGGDPSERVVFVAAPTNGAYGGITGADNHCQTQADNAGLSGNYYAWLADSDPNSAPAIRFEQSSTKYVMPTGEVIANNWDDLVDGSIQTNLDTLANGENFGSTRTVRTNVNTDGTQFSSTNHCNNYTNTGGGSMVAGDVARINSEWTNSALSSFCNQGHRLYCFEQGPIDLTGCSSPTGKAGEMNYNLAQGVMQYCDGENWISMGPRSAEAGSGPEVLSPTAPTSGLIGHWQLDDTNTIALDNAGSNNGSMQGGLSGASDSVAGKHDQAINLDGVDDYIDLGTSAQLKPALPVTVSGWVNVNDLTLGFPIFRSDYVADSYSGFWLSINPSGTINASYGDIGGAGPSSRRTKVGTTALTTGRWYHVAGVIRGPTDMDIYVNGINDNGTYSGTAGPMAYASGSAVIGLIDSTPTPGGEIYGNGSVDDVRVYNRDLSPEEVANIYKASSLVGHWTLDETTGITAEDSSENGHDGTLIGAMDDTFWRPGDGANGGSLAFENTDGNGVRLPFTAFDFSQAYSYTGWIKTPGAFGSIIGKGWGVNNFDSYLELRGNYLRFFPRSAGGSSGNYFDTPADSISPDTWHHFAAVSNGDSASIYINGVLAANSASWSPDSGASAANFYIGARYDYLTSSVIRSVDAQIDDVRIFNRALAADEVELLFATTGGDNLAISGCSAPGEPCDDGTIYAGTSPDGDLPMYTTAADQPNRAWAPAGGYVETFVTSYSSGAANTDRLLSIDANSSAAGFQIHPAANECATLDVHGHDDWYLPAYNEL